VDDPHELIMPFLPQAAQQLMLAFAHPLCSTILQNDGWAKRLMIDIQCNKLAKSSARWRAEGLLAHQLFSLS